MTREIKDKWVNVRITPTLLEKLKDLAAAEHRTISSQVVQVLETYFKSKGK